MTLTLGVNPEWMEDAKCRTLDPAEADRLFFSEDIGRSASLPGRRFCDGGRFRGDEPCPVRAQCLELAIANDDRFGVWGGLSERQRRRMHQEATPRQGGYTREARERNAAAAAAGE